MYIPLNGRRKEQKERDSMFFAETPGLSNTVSFKDMTDDILNDKQFQDRKSNLEKGKIKAIHASKMKFDAHSIKLIPIPL